MTMGPAYQNAFYDWEKNVLSNMPSSIKKHYKWEDHNQPKDDSTSSKKSSHRSSFHPASSTITTRSSIDSISTSKSKKSEASSKSPDIVDLTSNKSSSRRNSKSTNRRHSKSPSIHGKIPPTIREGEKNPWIPVGEIDPEYYVHPNYWKNINTITEKAREPTLVKRPVLSPKLIWRGELSTFTTYKRVIAGHCCQAGAEYIVQPKFLELYEKHGEGALNI